MVGLQALDLPIGVRLPAPSHPDETRRPRAAFSFRPGRGGRAGRWSGSAGAKRRGRSRRRSASATAATTAPATSAATSAASTSRPDERLVNLVADSPGRAPRTRKSVVRRAASLPPPSGPPARSRAEEPGGVQDLVGPEGGRRDRGAVARRELNLNGHHRRDGGPQGAPPHGRRGRAAPRPSGPQAPRPFFSILAQLSRRETVRLNTSEPDLESSSQAK